MTDVVYPAVLLEPLGMQEIELAAGLRHSEIYTMSGLLGLLWHGPVDAEHLVVACPGGMGGFMGPGRAIYHELGTRLAAHGVGTVRIDYRRPSRLESCVLDAVAAIDLAAQRGAGKAVAIGHSFGGAVAVSLGVALPTAVAGVCTLSTQSAGCEMAARLAPRPFLLMHGANDEVLPPETSDVVRRLAGGHGEVMILPEDGHGLEHSSAMIVDHLEWWVQDVLNS